MLDLLTKYFIVDGIYGQTYLNGDIDKQIKNFKYSSTCRVPYGIRKFIPATIKDYFLKSKGLSVPRWEDFSIHKVDNIEQLKEKYSTQLYVCKRC